MDLYSAVEWMFGNVLPCEECPRLTTLKPLSPMSQSHHIPLSTRATERLNNGLTIPIANSELRYSIWVLYDL
jgi:hypothetical protein